MASLAPSAAAPARGRVVDALWPLAVAGVLALQAVLVLTHEPWMDEWQALQVALATPNLSALLAALHYEGHPPLWYLLLRGIAWAVPGPHVLAATLLPIACGIQWLVLRLPTLPRWERLAIALNYTLLIEAGSLSRSLSLGILLLILAFTAERRPMRWIAIALLPMADFLFGLLSLVAIAKEWRDGSLCRPGLLLWAIVAALAALSVVPAPDMAPAMPLDDLFTQFVRAMAALSPQMAPVHMIGPVLTWGGAWYPVPASVAGGPVFLLLAVFILRDAPFERTLFLLYAGVCLAITLTLYWLSVRHFALVGLLLILLRIHAGTPATEERKAWRVWLLLGAAGGLGGTVLSLIQPFDAGRAMAREIRNRNLGQENLVAWQEGVVQGVGVMAGREFTSLSMGCTEGFHVWNHRPAIAGRDGLHRALADYARAHGHFYLVTDLGIQTAKVAAPMREVAFVPRGYDGYAYHLYELAWDRPRIGPAPRPCAPARLPLVAWYGSGT